jgi:hypothetical protein
LAAAEAVVVATQRLLQRLSLAAAVVVELRV